MKHALFWQEVIGYNHAHPDYNWKPWQSNDMVYLKRSSPFVYKEVLWQTETDEFREVYKPWTLNWTTIYVMGSKQFQPQRSIPTSKRM